MRVLFLCSLLLSCGENTYYLNSINRDIGLYNTIENRYETDPEFFELKNSFEQIFSVKVDVPIVFNHNLKEDTGALCSFHSNGVRIIEVNYYGWNSPPFLYQDNKLIYREIILFHELAHCILGKVKHRNKEALFNIEDVNIESPASILHFQPMIPPSIYLKYYRYFMRELAS